MFGQICTIEGGIGGKPGGFRSLGEGGTFLYQRASVVKSFAGNIPVYGKAGNRREDMAKVILRNKAVFGNGIKRDLPCKIFIYV